MGHFQLSFGAIVNTLAVAQEFAHAENGGEGVVELVGNAGEHLTHGGEFFSLDELLLEALDFRNVAVHLKHGVIDE